MVIMRRENNRLSGNEKTLCGVLERLEWSLDEVSDCGMFSPDLLQHIDRLREYLREPPSRIFSSESREVDDKSPAGTGHAGDRYHDSEDTLILDATRLCEGLPLEPIQHDQDEVIEVDLFGPFKMHYRGRLVNLQRHRKASQVLKYLLLHRKGRVPRELLMELFWPEYDEEKARNNLNVNIYHARKALADTGMEQCGIGYEGGCYFLAEETPLRLDTEVFLCARQRAKAAFSRNDEVEGIAQLETALSCYTGTLLQEDQYEDWAASIRQEYERLYGGVLRQLRSAYIRSRRHEALVELCLRAMKADPLDETSLTCLMWAYQAQGRRHLAIRKYLAYAKTLSEEMGVIPSRDVREAFMDLRAGKNWSLPGHEGTAPQSLGVVTELAGREVGECA